MADDKELQIIIRLKDLATKSIRELTKSLDKLSKRGFGAAKKAASVFLGTLRKVTKAVFSWRGAIAGIGMGALIKSFIDAASKAENLRVRLSTLTGSLREGNRLFKEMAELASQVPHTFEEIMEGATRLIGVVEGGVDQVKQLMPLILDLSTATGLAVNDVTAQVIRMWSAGAAAADMFRERGVLAMLGFQAGAKHSVAETRKMLIEAWESPISKFRGASEALADTWTGLMSMLQDAWFQFRVSVMESGLFQMMKAGVKSIVDAVKELREDGKLDEWAKEISDSLVTAIRTIIMFAGQMYDSITSGMGKVIKVVTDLVQKAADLADILSGDFFDAKNAEEVLKATKALKELKPVVESRKKALFELNAAYEKGWVKADEYKEVHAQMTSELRPLVRQMFELERKSKDIVSADSQAIIERNAMIDAIREFAVEMDNGNTGTEKAIELLALLDKQMQGFSIRQKERDEQAGQRFAGMTPQVFQFSEAEQEARAAARGAIELTMAMQDLNHQYKQGAISVEEYYRKRSEFAATQRDKERAALESQLDELEELEVLRRQDIQQQLIEITRQIEAGTRTIEDEATAYHIDRLNAKFEADKDYLEKRRAIENELLKLTGKSTEEQRKLDQDEKTAQEQRDKKALNSTIATTSGMASAFKDMYDATGQQSKEFFIAWKAMQIAQTLISTYSAAQEAYKSASAIPLVGPYVAPAASALAVAQGLARVAMIRAQTMATGGEVDGFSPNATADNIPAMLTAGEYVHPVNTVKHYGVQAMEAIRRRAVPKSVLAGFASGGPVPAPASMRFANGGSVPGPDDAPATEGGNGASVTNVNLVDPSLMDQYLGTRAGERSVLNVISKNSFQVKQIMEQ
jgi:hypothetical protein